MAGFLRVKGRGGASALSWKPDDSSLYPLHATYGDEFSGAVIGAQWTKRNIAEAETSQAAPGRRDNSALRLTFDAQGDAIYQPAPPGDFEIVAGFRNMATHPMLGLAVIDVNGDGVGCSPYTDERFFMWQIVNYIYSVTGSGLPVPAVPITNFPFWIRLRKAGTTYSGFLSSDGENWTSAITRTSTITVDRIGVARLFTGVSVTADLTRFNVFEPTYTP